MSAAYKLTRQDGAGIRSTTEVVGSDGRDVGDLRKAALMHARQSCSCVVRWKQQLSQAVLVASTLAAASMLFLAGSFFWVPFVVFPLFFLFAGIFSTHSRCKSFRCHVWYRSQGSPETHNSPAFLSIPLDITHSKRKARFFSRPLPFAGLRMGE